MLLLIVYTPVTMIFVGLIVCLCAWSLLDGESLSRKYCGKMILGMYDGLDSQKVKKYQQYLRDQKQTQGEIFIR